MDPTLARRTSLECWRQQGDEFDCYSAGAIISSNMVNFYLAGITDDATDVKTIDKFEPSNRDEFADFQKMLVEKITKYEVCELRFYFLKRNRNSLPCLYECYAWD